MAKTREIKRRMQSVTNTRQITSAMKMVSASKLRRAQGFVGAGEQYRDKLKQVIGEVAHVGGMSFDSLLLKARPVKRAGFMVFASNKGLAGGYNSSLLNFALAEVQKVEAEGIDIGIMAVGRKAADFFKKRGYQVDLAALDTVDIPEMSDSEALARYITSAYTSEQYDQVTVIYQKFKSAMSQTPVAVPILPFQTKEVEEDKESKTFHDDYIFEPNAAEILEALLPLYLSNQLYAALVDAKVGEHGARMTAMTAATDNATDLLATLEISFNRARQTAITNEITEIVAGADALG